MYGLNIDPMNNYGNPSVSELRELGVQTVRFSYIDRQPSFHLDTVAFDIYNRKLRELKDNGIKSLIILTYDTYPGKPAFTASDQEWANYISAYVVRCGQIAALFAQFKPAFQIWNEPDLAPAPGYEPSLREAVYGAMLVRTRAIIKTYSPGSPVIGAGLASGDPSWWRRVVQSQPGQALIDANALHPYGQRPEPDWPSPNWGFGYAGDLIRRYQAEFDGFWWITESGVKDVSDEMQAEYLRKMYKNINENYSASGLHNPNGGVKQVSWFCYSDGMVTPYGLVRGDSTRKPAWNAYRQISIELKDPT